MIPPLVVATIFVGLITSGLSLVVRHCGELPQPLKHSVAIYDGNHCIYLLGGLTSSGEASTKIYKYNMTVNITDDPSLAVTTLDTEFPSGVFHGVAVATSDLSDIYYLGGGDIYSDNVKTEIYRISNITSDIGRNITLVGNLPYPTAGATAHFDGIGDIYIFGGQMPGMLDSVMKFNVTDGTTVTLPGVTLPYPVSRAGSVNISGNVYIFGGWNGAIAQTPVYSNRVISYNLDTMTSTVLEGVLPRGVLSPVVVNSGSLAYILGGYAYNKYPNQGVTRFNVETNQVQEFCPADTRYRLLPREAAGIRYEPNNTVYIFGGVTHGIDSQILCIELDTIDKGVCPPPPDDDGVGTLSGSLTLVVGILVATAQQFF